MKICFLLQRSFAYISHNLAVLLKENYGIKDFCGYVYSRSSYRFLKKQNDIEYNALLLDEDVHKEYKKERLDINFLRQLEKEYGVPNLWPFLAPDRILMFNQPIREYPYDTPKYSHEEMLRILQVKARKIIEFLKQEKPDVIFSSVVGATGSLLLYHIGKKMGIQTLNVFPAYLKNRFIIDEDYVHFTVKQLNKEEETERNNYHAAAKELLYNFRKQPHPYYVIPTKKDLNRSKHFQFLLPNKLPLSILAFVQQLRYFLTKKEDRSDYSYITPWNFLKDRIKRKVRNLWGYNDLYDDFNPKIDFAFYPLQYEPEFSLLVQSPFYHDQKYIIRQLAKSLPVGFELYVKEHPDMFGYRPRSYYLELKKIPNVKLINSNISSFEIIPHAKLVSTVTGAGAWEAALLKVPSICFGHTFYNQISFIKTCRTMEELPFTVKEQLENYQYNETELLNFIAGILKDSVEIDLFSLWFKEQEPEKQKRYLQPLATLLAKKIGLVP